MCHFLESTLISTSLDSTSFSPVSVLRKFSPRLQYWLSLGVKIKSYVSVSSWLLDSIRKCILSREKPLPRRKGPPRPGHVGKQGAPVTDAQILPLCGHSLFYGNCLHLLKKCVSHCPCRAQLIMAIGELQQMTYITEIVTIMAKDTT